MTKMVPVIVALLSLLTLALGLAPNPQGPVSIPLFIFPVSKSESSAVLPFRDEPKDPDNSYNPKRVARPDEISKFAEKGRFLGCLMDASDASAGKAWPDPYGREPKSARTIWPGTLENELATWGWTEFDEYNQEENCEFIDNSDDAQNRIEVAVKALGLNRYPAEKSGDNICYSVEHSSDDMGPKYNEDTYSVDEKTYSMTGAYYRFGPNRRGGAICALDLKAPMRAANQNWTTIKEDPTLDMMPELGRASEVLAAYWLRDNPSPGILRYFFANHVMNRETNRIIARIMQDHPEHDGVLPLWPGIEVSIADDLGEALQGAPLGAILSYFLLQHKAELGKKHITDITIFRDLNYKPELLFHIKDVPKEAPVDPTPLPERPKPPSGADGYVDKRDNMK